MVIRNQVLAEDVNTIGVHINSDKAVSAIATVEPSIRDSGQIPWDPRNSVGPSSTARCTVKLSTVAGEGCKWRASICKGKSINARGISIEDDVLVSVLRHRFSWFRGDNSSTGWQASTERNVVHIGTATAYRCNACEDRWERYYVVKSLNHVLQSDNGGRQRARPMWFPFVNALCRAPLHGVVIRQFVFLRWRGKHPHLKAIASGYLVIDTMKEELHTSRGFNHVFVLAVLARDFAPTNIL